MLPENEDVVAFTRHPQSECHGFNGALLANEFRDIGKLDGGCEAEAVRRAMPVKFFGGQGLRGAHRHKTLVARYIALARE
jgi:hypothetical protein